MKFSGSDFLNMFAERDCFCLKCILQFWRKIDDVFSVRDIQNPYFCMSKTSKKLSCRRRVLDGLWRPLALPCSPEAQSTKPWWLGDTGVSCSRDTAPTKAAENSASCTLTFTKNDSMPWNLRFQLCRLSAPTSLSSSLAKMRGYFHTARTATNKLSAHRSASSSGRKPLACSLTLSSSVCPPGRTRILRRRHCPLGCF